ncbi:MAG: hypothetical protein F4Z01_04875 [Gammaproteobacteria bacterium]|nr:hypothetical protein [Gammaproteobacteria bacterium]MYF38025.1 hypothetical protein [Gammaproteobacteria bacterium]
MARTSGQPSVGPNSRRLMGISFTAGLTLGVLAVIAIQILWPQTELSSQDSAQDIGQQYDTNESSTTGTVVTEKFEDVFRHQRIFDQNKALHDMLSEASETELKDWWGQSQKIERKSQREIVQDAILRKLVGVNPQEALRYVDGASKFRVDTLLHSVFSEWAVANLDEAIEAATTLSGSRRVAALQAMLEFRDDLSENELRQIAQQLEGEEIFFKYVSDTKASQNIANPQESWEILLGDNVDDYLQTESLTIVAKAWREQIGFEVLSKIYNTETEYFRAKLEWVSAVAQADIAGALEYARGVSDEQEKRYLSTVVAREWARTDALAALTAVSTIEPSSLASEIETAVAYVWATTNPRELITNIAVIPEEARLLPLESAFSRIAMQDPAEAIAQLSSVEDYVGNTSTIVRRIVMQWSYQEPAEAANWVVNNFEEDDPQRRTLLQNVLPRLANIDPNQAFELAIAQPAPSSGFGLEIYVIYEVAGDGDIELAQKFLPRVSENTQTIAYSEVGSAMVRNLQINEAIELGNDLEGRNQTIYYGRVFSAWASDSPKNLYESLENFPTSELKSTAARQLITQNQYEPVLNDEQIERARTFLNSDDENFLKRIESR